MKKTLKRITAARMTERMVRADAIRERLDWAAAHGEEEILRKYGTPGDGLTAELAERSRERYGTNILTYGKRESAVKRMFSAFINPFTVILLVLAGVSPLTGLDLAGAGGRN